MSRRECYGNLIVMYFYCTYQFNVCMSVLSMSNAKLPACSLSRVCSGVVMLPCLASCRCLSRLQPCVGQSVCETHNCVLGCKTKGAAFGKEQQHWLAAFANEYWVVNKLASLQTKSSKRSLVLLVRYCPWEAVLLLPECICFCSCKVYRVVDSYVWGTQYSQAALLAGAVMQLASSLPSFVLHHTNRYCSIVWNSYGVCTKYCTCACLLYFTFKVCFSLDKGSPDIYFVCALTNQKIHILTVFDPFWNQVCCCGGVRLADPYTCMA